MPDASAKRAAFRALHESGCFLIPNPWDAGSARALEALGFPALASTSAGLAFSLGLPDSPTALELEAVLAHLREIVAATELPLNADFQAGYAENADGVAAHVSRCVETGVAGLSIEDTTGDAEQPLFELSEALERLGAARSAIDAAGGEVLLTARAECFLVGHSDPLAESIRRLQAYAEAGADVLFAPGVSEREDIAAIVEAVGPKPVNVLISANTGLRMKDLAELGVRRVSVGSALARVAWGAFLSAAKRIAEDGEFSGLEGAATFADLNTLFESSSRP
jgi:2-methylisocitrate lyase-like PEP mutase family enzyme